MKITKTGSGYRVNFPLEDNADFHIDANTSYDEGYINIPATGSIGSEGMIVLMEAMQIANLLAKGGLTLDTPNP